ncbi:DUF2306 domain-containing protein [Nostocoides sp. F2B08]|uniref:DUF2306 domain-containing protein n=1 Tax=Nostocoides sp. F2B08 TaxID=2653936 RepID=UPI0012636318|nr:DUF2306 domain-containing protein [Tetrasphaera sp. F2B08]KAB7744194.1 DUF2306 domain-containing protein [Tetrasphaera sp. F2B08]
MSVLQVSGHPAAPRSSVRSGSGWRLAVGLVLLSAIPLLAGALRLMELAGGPEVRPADPRFGEVPVALIVHIVGSALFALVGVLQFLPRFRRSHRRWHRRAGRALMVTGLAVGGSALWLTVFYEAQPGTGALLYAFRLVFGTAMLVSLVLGFVAIRRGEVHSHRTWVIRAYAIGLGAGTQVFTEGFAEALFGEGVLVGDVAKGAGWVVNLAVAEWAIRRRSDPRTW